MGLDVLERKAAQEVRRAVGLATRQDALRYAVRIMAHSLRLCDASSALGTSATRAAIDQALNGPIQAFAAEEKRRLEIARRGGRV